MKSYMSILVIVFLAHCGGLFLSMQAAQNMGYVPFPIVINIGSSEDSGIVDAIKVHSDLTDADEKSWQLSWVPFVGSNIHFSKIEKVRKYLGVCAGWFYNTNNPMSHYGNYEAVQVCKATDNLIMQGLHARAVLGKFGTVAEKGMYSNWLEHYISRLKNNKAQIASLCNTVKQSKEAEKQRKANKEQLNIQRERNRVELNKAWWRTQQLRWQVAKEMGTSLFNGVKWVAKTVNENSAPLASAAAMWFVYDKLFGTTRPVAK
jgi:hypothetical protein